MWKRAASFLYFILYSVCTELFDSISMKKLSIQKSGIDGKGLFVLEDVKKDEFIHYIEGKRVRKIPLNKLDGQGEMRNWYGVGKSIWIDPEGTNFDFLNHSCDPNAAIKGTKSLVALRDIKIGEELTIDYSITDPDPLWEMPCLCGADNCRKLIRSIEHLPSDVFKKHFPNIPRYFQKVYIRHYIKSKVE